MENRRGGEFHFVQASHYAWQRFSHTIKTGVNTLSLALFDLDNTLLAGDSDYLWGCFLVDKGIVDKTIYENANQRFYDQYKIGRLDIHAFLDFQLKPLADHTRATLETWRAEYIEHYIVPILLPAAKTLIAKHRAGGDTPVIITATNRFITGPIADLYSVEHLIATEPEKINSEYTGNITGIPCFQEGKITLLQTWLKENNETLDDSWFYSDSHNDLPLLNTITHPVAVDPDEILRQHAETAGWPIMSFR